MSWKVYVIHFDKPYKHAKHYTGIAIDVDKRMKEHKGKKIWLKINGCNYKK